MIISFRYGIIRSINENLSLGNITQGDARRLRSLTQKLYAHLYAHYEEMEELNEMTDESLLLEYDIIEMEHEAELAKMDAIISEKENTISKMDIILPRNISFFLYGRYRASPASLEYRLHTRNRGDADSRI